MTACSESDEVMDDESGESIEEEVPVGDECKLSNVYHSS